MKQSTRIRRFETAVGEIVTCSRSRTNYYEHRDGAKCSTNLILFLFFVWFRKRDGGGSYEFRAAGSQSGALAVTAATFAATVIPATPSATATGPTVQGGPGTASLPTTLYPRETGMGIRFGPDRQPSLRLLAKLPRSVCCTIL